MTDIETNGEGDYCAGCSAWVKTGEHSTSCLYLLIARLESGETPFRSVPVSDGGKKPAVLDASKLRSWWRRLLGKAY